MSDKIQFRLSTHIGGLLRDFAERHGWPPSKAARFLVETSLTRDPEQAAISEIIWSVQAEARAKTVAIESKFASEVRTMLAPGAARPKLPSADELVEDHEPGESVDEEPDYREDDDEHLVETEDGPVVVMPPRSTSGPLPSEMEPLDPGLHGRRRRRRGKRGGRRR